MRSSRGFVINISKVQGVLTFFLDNSSLQSPSFSIDRGLGNPKNHRLLIDFSTDRKKKKKEKLKISNWFLMEVYEPQMSTIPSHELFPSSRVSDAISDSLPADLETGSGDYAQIPEISGERELTSSNLEMSQVPENSGEREVSSSNMEGVSLEPYVGQEYKSEQEAKAFYNGYARQTGFSIRKGPLYRSSRDRAVTSRIFVCSKEGFRRETSDVNEKGNLKRRMAVTRVGCKAQLWVKKQPSGMWVVKQFQREHNHELTPMKPHLLRSHKNMLDNVKEYVETLKGVGVDTSKIQSLFVEEARAIGKIGDAEKDTESEDKKKIHELTVELHRERRRSASYRQQLQMVLKDIEDHAFHLSKQVEDIVGNVKEIESQGNKDFS